MALTADMVLTDDVALTDDMAAFDWMNDVALTAYVVLTDDVAWPMMYHDPIGQNVDVALTADMAVC